MSDTELLQNILNGVNDIKNEVNGMKTEISNIKTMQEKDSLAFETLEHSVEANKAASGRINGDIANIDDHLSNIDKSIGIVKDIADRRELDITLVKRNSV